MLFCQPAQKKMEKRKNVMSKCEKMQDVVWLLTQINRKLINSWWPDWD